MKQHKYRFGVSGKALSWFWKKPSRRATRKFPKWQVTDASEYMKYYYQLNCGYVRFVGVNYVM